MLPSAPIYYLNNIPLDILSEIKDLRQILDSKLSFAPHFNYIISKSSLIDI